MAHPSTGIWPKPVHEGVLFYDRGTVRTFVQNRTSSGRKPWCTYEVLYQDTWIDYGYTSQPRTRLLTLLDDVLSRYSGLEEENLWVRLTYYATKTDMLRAKALLKRSIPLSDDDDWLTTLTTIDVPHADARGNGPTLTSQLVGSTAGS
jgi:hypothetical protein